MPRGYNISGTYIDTYSQKKFWKLVKLLSNRSACIPILTADTDESTTTCMDLEKAGALKQEVYKMFQASVTTGPLNY